MGGWAAPALPDRVRVSAGAAARRDGMGPGPAEGVHRRHLPRPGGLAAVPRHRGAPGGHPGARRDRTGGGGRQLANETTPAWCGNTGGRGRQPQTIPRIRETRGPTLYSSRVSPRGTGLERKEKPVSTTDCAIEARQLVKTYAVPGIRHGGQQGIKALDGLDISVPRGMIYGLLGPNGAGKSTTVKILTSLAKPDSGTARVDGIDVLARPGQVRQMIGVVAQRSGADPTAH